MVVLDPGRRRRELADELVVDQEALDQGAEVRIAHPEQNLAQPRHQLGDVLRALRQEVLGLDLRGIDDLEVGEDDLQRPLEDLGLAADVQEIARLEQSGQALARVPEPGADGARLVAELEVEIEVALAIGPELLVGDQERLVDRVAMDELIDVATSHAGIDSNSRNEPPSSRARCPVGRLILGTLRRRGQVRPPGRRANDLIRLQ